MDVLKISLLILLFIIMKPILNAQPTQFNYQGVARNVSGLPVANQNIKIRLKIHSGSANGSVEYSETRNVTTNAFGLFTIAIGSSGAIEVTGALASINWSNESKFLQVELDAAGGTNFIDMGTTQLLSVPFALMASKANNVILPLNQVANTSVPALVIGNSGTGDAIYGGKGFSGLSLPFPAGVVGQASGNNIGVAGLAQTGNGMYAESLTGDALYAISHSSSKAAVYGVTDHYLGIAVAGQTTSGIAGNFSSNNGVALRTSGKVEINNTGQTAGKVLMTDASGHARWEGGVAFSAFNNAGPSMTIPNATETVVSFDNEEYDLGNDFTVSSSFINPSTFIAPVDGIYHFDAIVGWEGFNANGSTMLHLKKNGTTFYSVTQIAHGINHSAQLSIDVRLPPGTKVTLAVSQVSGQTQFVRTANTVTRFTGRFVSRP